MEMLPGKNDKRLFPDPFIDQENQKANCHLIRLRCRYSSIDKKQSSGMNLCIAELLRQLQK
jgi:hypothetical protein